MDFFEAQARARKRTGRLVALFGLAVAGTALAMYVAAVLIVGDTAAFHLERLQEIPGLGESVAYRWWQPRLFAGVTAGTLAVVGLASLYKWHEYSAGGRVVAEALGARRIEPGTTEPAERRLANVVEEMAIASGVPVPPVYVMDDEPAINAFAAGLTTSDAVVAVTRGTLEKLSRDELQGVIGHEFSHVLNGDMRLNMRLTALLFGILMLGQVGRTVLRGFGRSRSNRSRGKGGGGIVLVGLALMVVGYVGYFFGRLVQAAVSRQREFLADASAVQFTRNPGGIAGALKKIGGYALGSSILSSQSAEVRHFFFAQGFRSGFLGWWSTHPPLGERIRAIEPQFDGTMFEPPELVDVARESFQTAGFGRAHRLSPDEAARRAFAAGAYVPPVLPPARIPFQPAAAIASIGTLAPEQIDRAQQLLDDLPEQLRDAAHSVEKAAILVFALLFDDDPAIRARQRNLVSSRRGSAALVVLDALEPLVRSLGPEQRLPVLQLALPVLRQIPEGNLASFLDVLDELVHADEKVSPFEFALQKLLVRTLELSRSPGAAATQYHSFYPLADDLSVMLSALASAAARDLSFAPRAFAAGAAQLRLVEDRLRLTTDCSLVALDGALDKLARASLPIKQRALTAAAHVVNADGRIEIAELELLRAVAAALDCPMPPVGLAAVA